MSGKKGMKNYTIEFKSAALKRIDNGEISLRGFCRESGVSRYAVQEWRRMQNGKIVLTSRKKGRSRRKPLTTIEELTAENKELKMENELLRSFLKASGRK